MKSGQIIKTEAYTFAGIPFIYHYGLIIVENNKTFIIHNDRKNGTIKQTYNNFIYNNGDVRKVSSVSKSKLENLSNIELNLRFNNCNGGFNWLNYNCEHFIDCVSKKKKRSEQLLFCGLIATVLILIKKVK